MRAFAYQGDHTEVTLYGVTFPCGVLVQVTDAFLIAKLEGNSHFVEGPLSPDVSVEAQEDAPKRRGRKPKEH